MLEWARKDPKYNESVFGINFKEDEPELAKQLSNEQGFYIDGKTTTRGEWTYKAKKVTAKKDGKEYWFVERFQGKSSPSYEDGAKKGHLENVEMHKEAMEVIKENTKAILSLLAEILAKNSMEGKTFVEGDKV